jgi:glycosyltransferase involved in cell wall biosynthesis
LVSFAADASAQSDMTMVASVREWPYKLEDFARQPPWSRAAFRVVDLYNPFAGHSVASAIERFRPDVVHSHSVIGLSTAALTAASRSRTAHVHHLHDYWLLCRRTTLTRRSGDLCEHRCRTCSAISGARSLLLDRHPPDIVLAPSKSVAQMHASLHWASGRIRLLAHPVPARSGPRTRPVPVAGEPVVFGYLGQLTAAKGVRTLLEAFSDLGGRGHRLILGGRGPLLGEVELAGTSVTALGWLDPDAKSEFFEQIDCLVVPSQWPEIGPLVALEALAQGVPVVGARIGAVPENIDPSSEPLLFSPGNIADLRSALWRFVTDPVRYVPSGGGRAGWPEHVSDLVGYYEEAIALRGARR